jgi:Asp-tRNA(Asn)/Glu-tRNA(Gln) amidotransferase A subunit family amidase
VVLEAYISRAAYAHSRTNCLTEIMFDTACTRAKTLDDEFSRTGQVTGPLHGVPVSLKDQCGHMKGCDHALLTTSVVEAEGYDSTLGFTGWANQPGKRNAEVRKMWLRAPYHCSYVVYVGRPIAHQRRRCSFHKDQRSVSRCAALR